MAKSHRRSMIKRLKRTASKTLPVVDKGLKTVGVAATDVAKKSVPVIEKGVSVVYGTMATGLDLGVKGVKAVSQSVRSNKRHRSHRRMSGGKKTRKHRRRHH